MVIRYTVTGVDFTVKDYKNTSLIEVNLFTIKTIAWAISWQNAWSYLR